MSEPSGQRFLTRGRVAALLLAGAAAVALAIGGLGSPAEFFSAYLVAYAFWMGVSLGSLALAMLVQLARGHWGRVAQRCLMAGASTLPLMAVLLLPLVFGVRWLYPWADPQVVAADPLLAQKQGYLNVPFFLARSGMYLLAWLALWLLLRRGTRRYQQTGDARLARRLQQLSALGLGIIGLTATFAAIDWLMSLEPRWYSSVYGSIVAMGGVLGAFALTTAVTALAARRRAFQHLITPRVLNDLGDLLLAFVLLWAYVSFSQMLIIWSGNLPEEVVWYTRRLEGGWQAVAVALAVTQFAIPFALLIIRWVKRSAWLLAGVAGLIFVTRYLDLYWMVKPAVAAGWHWLDPVAAVGVGALWFTIFSWSLSRQPRVGRRWPATMQVEKQTPEEQAAPDKRATREAQHARA